MKNQPGTMKTIQTDLGRAGISKNVTDRQNLPIIYRYLMVWYCSVQNGFQYEADWDCSER